MDIVRSRPAAVPQPLARPGATRAPGGAPSPAAAASDPKRAEAPSLWHLLTPEERTFFQQLSHLGPLTYRPGSGDTGARAGADAPTGHRIDVRG